MRVHELKCWPVLRCSDDRHHNIYAMNDRDFQVGDLLHLREWDPTKEDGSYTGQETMVEVRDVWPAEFLPVDKASAPLKTGYCLMTVRLVDTKAHEPEEK